MFPASAWAQSVTLRSPGSPQHRTLQPSGSAHGHTRFGDALEAIKQEHDLVAAELLQARTLRDEYEAKGASLLPSFAKLGFNLTFLCSDLPCARCFHGIYFSRISPFDILMLISLCPG
jgi:hypothetical protein